MTQQHLERYKELVQVSKYAEKPLENMPFDYQAAFYLLSCEGEILYKTKPYVSKIGIDFDKLLRMQEYDFDYNYYMELIRLAACLFRAVPIQNLDCSKFTGAGVEQAAAALFVREFGLGASFTQIVP